jgi:small-conductance mechanosensitive channel
MNIDLSRFSLIISISIVVLTIALAYVFKRFFNRFILNSTKIVRNDPTNYKFLRHAITATIYLTGFSLAVYHIEPLRALANSLLAGAGIMAVALGFASQAALANVISGVFIVIFKPYGVNDRITVKDTLQGVVEDITLRHTVIRDFQNKRIVIPNSIISNEVVVNADLIDEKICYFFEAGISYDSDIKLAKRIIQEEALKHPSLLDNRTLEQIEEGVEQVMVRVISFGDSAVNLRAYIWAKDLSDGFVMHCDLLESVKERFDAGGIEIPFPHRTLVFKNSKTAETDNAII